MSLRAFFGIWSSVAIAAYLYQFRELTQPLLALLK